MRRRPPEPPPREDGEIPCLADYDTGLPDEGEAKGPLGPQAHRLSARRVVAPAQESAQGPAHATEHGAPQPETQGVTETLDPRFAEGEEHPEEPPPRHQKSQRFGAVPDGEASGERPRGTCLAVLVARRA
jgi:hypothetical protein